MLVTTMKSSRPRNVVKLCSCLNQLLKSYDDFSAKFALTKSELTYLRQNSSHLLPIRNAYFHAKLFSICKLEQTSILVETSSLSDSDCY